MKGRRRNPRTRDLHTGQGLAELALILPLLLTILLGTLDLGRAFYTYIALTNAAREAARYAAVNDSGASITQVQHELKSGGTDISGCACGTSDLCGHRWRCAWQRLHRKRQLPICPR